MPKKQGVLRDEGELGEDQLNRCCRAHGGATSTEALTLPTGGADAAGGGAPHGMLRSGIPVKTGITVLVSWIADVSNII